MRVAFAALFTLALGLGALGAQTRDAGFAVFSYAQTAPVASIRLDVDGGWVVNVRCGAKVRVVEACP